MRQSEIAVRKVVKTYASYSVNQATVLEAAIGSGIYFPEP